MTICIHNKECILGNVIVGEGFHALPHIKLSTIGKEIEKSIRYTNEKYDCIDKYIIMPNHIHMIIMFHEADRRGTLSLQDIIGRLKSFTTMKFNEINRTKDYKLWQRSYHDHIIRNEQEHKKICQYIDTNPLKWELDCYHVK